MWRADFCALLLSMLGVEGQKEILGIEGVENNAKVLALTVGQKLEDTNNKNTMTPRYVGSIVYNILQKGAPLTLVKG